MEWARDFYSRTGSWWGNAESRGGADDQLRLQRLHRYAGDEPKRVLELGAGYGTTAALTAKAGHDVTAVEFSDRADFAPSALRVRREDFYLVELPERFDVVCYWDGFGVGSDADQRRLLRRIAHEWLLPDGIALIDVYNPFVWAGWDGDEGHRMPDPARGYEHELFELATFDPVSCTATDTWWDAADPDHRISQVLRCYTPADLALLLGGTGLELFSITAGDETFAPPEQPADRDLMRRENSYLAALRRERP